MVEKYKINNPNEFKLIEDTAKQAMQILKPSLLNDVLKDLERDIKNISWQISIVVWFKTKKAINNLKVNANEKLDKQIDELLDKLTPMFGGL